MYGISRKIYLVLFVLTFISLAVLFFKSDGTLFDASSQPIVSYEDGWVYNENVSLVYNYLPKDIKTGSGISFFTKNQFLDVYINEKLIYSFLPDTNGKWKMAGSQWHFIDLSSEYGGEKITLHFYGNDKKSLNLPNILIGNKEELFRRVIVEEFLPFVLSCVLVSFGIIFCAGWMVYRKKIGVTINILYIGLFTIAAGICSGILTQVPQLFIGHTYDLATILNFIILLVQYPIMRCVVSAYVSSASHNKKRIDVIVTSFLVVTFLVVGSFIFYGIDSNILGQIAQAISLLSGLIIFIIMLLAYRRVNGKRKSFILIHLICLPVMGIFLTIDFVSYYYLGATDGARCSRVGASIYMGIIAVETLKQFMRVLSMGQDSEKMKNIAYCDALTCMGNRTAFMKSIHEISRDDFENYGIAMFDLNNLKVFNDVHGHSAGDYYLIISSEIIQDIFGEKGKICRIGGDEFCAVLKDYSLEEFSKGAFEMQDRLSQLKGPYTKEEMSIAYGYQIFDKKLDNDLSSTMERADSSMYRIKEKLKKDLKRYPVIVE